MRRKFSVILVFCLSSFLFLTSASATSQLIVNGGFEASSLSPWVPNGAAGVEILNSSSGETLYDGSQFLSMGNSFVSLETVYQTVILPTNLIAATLGLAFETLSSDLSGDDTFMVQIDSTTGTVLYNLATITSASTFSWGYSTTNFISYTTAGGLSAYAGQSVNVEFVAMMDPTYGNLTQFNIDDVALVVATTADIPANDDFSNAVVVPARGLTNGFNNTYASRESGEPGIVGNAGGHSLWWAWTATSLGTVFVNVPNNTFSNIVGVYTGTSVSDLTLVTNVYDRSFTFAAAPGTTYHIAVDGYNATSGTGDFVVRFTADKTPPVVTVTSPKAGANVSSSAAQVSGTASDNVSVASVYYRLTNSAGTNTWQLASGTTAWSATVNNLIPGSNTVQVEAYDTSTNLSKIVSRTFNYAVPVQLGLTIVGSGTVSGATNGELLELNDPYKLTAKPAAGFGFAGWTGSLMSDAATVSFDMSSNLDLTATFVDVTRPTLSITAPTAKQRWSNAVFTVAGKAKDNVGVAAIWYRLNGGLWAASGVSTTNGFANWKVGVTLTPGTNTISAFAQDAAGNKSLTNSITFSYILSAPVIVQTNGFGKVSPNYNGALLAISNNYTMTATAGKGYVFSNWTTTYGEVITNGPVLKFVMASNLDFVANFVPNPFPPVAGAYGGLFYNTNAGELSPASSGYFSAVVSATGSFTAKFQQGSKSVPISGQFSLTGGWSTPAVKAWNNTAISLELDMTGGNTLDGNLNNASWSADLSSVRAANPASQKGSYTLILPGTNDTSGDGFGAATVGGTGAVTFSGTLADGTKVTQSAIESEQGDWPVYISLDSGNGMLLGWVGFTNEPGQDIAGTLNWFKPGSFTNQVETAGSKYVTAKGQPVLGLTEGYVLLNGGGLSGSVSNQFYLGANDIVKGSNKLALTITTANGLFQGTVTNGHGGTIAIKGALLQNQTNGFGQFNNAGQIGSVYLAPQ